MNRLIYLLITATAVFTSACASQPAKTSPTRERAQFDGSPTHITRINDQFHFVVIDFSGRPMPAVGTIVSVYRGNERVGSVQITQPVRTHFATADILEGNLQVGDEAR